MCLIIYTLAVYYCLMLTGACISVEKISEFTNGEFIRRMKYIGSAYMLLESAVGGLSCRSPPVPKEWNHIDRPHVALIQPYLHLVNRILLSEPVCLRNGRCILYVPNLDTLNRGSVIEIKHSTDHITYFRREYGYWTKIAEARDPFFLHVFSHGLIPVVIELSEIYSE